MPKTEKAKEILNDFQDQYGEEKGKRIYYATAKKQNRDPDTFEKQECVLRLADDLMIEHNGEIVVIPAGTSIQEMAVSTGAIAMAPVALPIKNKNKKKKSTKK